MKGLKAIVLLITMPALALVACFMVFQFEEVKVLFINFYTNFSWDMVVAYLITGITAGYWIRSLLLKRGKKKAATKKEEK